MNYVVLGIRWFFVKWLNTRAKFWKMSTHACVSFDTQPCRFGKIPPMYDVYMGVCQKRKHPYV